MKILTTILIIIFVSAVILFGVLAVRFLAGRGSQDDGGPLVSAEEEIGDPQESTGDTPEEEISGLEEQEDSLDSLKIQAMEIYLDGNREDGIFLGEVKYGLTSKEAYNIYGEGFSESGFMLVQDNAEYDFTPGSIHYLYIYTFIPEYGWEYSRERIVIEGEPELSQSIELHLDSIRDNALIEKGTADLRVAGWSVDLSFTDKTGIERVEAYLNGPRGFGKPLGTAEYGIERQDVANAYANGNYTYSGYRLYFDTSMLEPGSTNTLYVYSFSQNGTNNYLTRDFIMEGEGVNQNVILSVEAELTDDSISITGWAVNENYIQEGAPPDPDQEYSLQKIVFVSDRNGNDDIYSMNMDGSGVTQLTDHTGNDKYPSVSPDGKKIAYTSDIDGNWQIFSMNWDGSDKTQLTSTPVRSGFPTWSFDGRYIFYEVYKDNDWEIYRINSGGSNIKRITFNTGVNDWHPFAHPFLKKVLFESGTVGNEEIYIMDFNGDNIQKVSDTAMRKRVPAISRDGTIIVFTSYEGNDYYLHIMDADGENITRVPNAPVNSGHPSISPDNKYLVFQVRTDKSDINDVYIIGLDGSDLTRLTDQAGNEWDPIFMFQIAE